jgi:hypothetical protein
MNDERQLRQLNLANLWPGFRELRGLTIDPDGSLGLARVPAFVEALGESRLPTEVPAGPAAVSDDAAGDIYLADPASHRLLRLDTCTNTSEPQPCFGGQGHGLGQLDTPRGLLVGPRDALYVADSGNHRVLVVDLATQQLRGVWGQPNLGDPPRASAAAGRFNEPWGLAADEAGHVYVVERAGQRVQKITPDGRVIPTFWDALSSAVTLAAPTDLTIAAREGEERLYLVDSDAGAGRVLVISTFGVVYDQWPLPEEVEPAGIAVGSQAIYVGDAHRGQVLQFDYHGDFQGAALGYRGPVAGLAVACDGSLLLYPGAGGSVVRLLPDQAYVHQGEFLAGPFEVGEGPTAWHRLRVLAQPLSGDAHLQLFTHTANDPDDPPVALGPVEEPFPGWQAAPPDQLDILILNDPCRYLWIGGRLHGDGTASPRLVQMQVTFPPDGYLRHLPAIYQEDERGRVLLRRALALFESLLGSLGEQINDLPLLFDPFAAPSGWAPWLTGWQGDDESLMAPPDWLPWLASWLAFDLDETWLEEKTRQAIADAVELYGARGTVEGLRRLIKLYAGVEARIEEPGQFTIVWSLGERSVLGFDTMLAPAHPQGAVLATTATLDASHLIDDDDYGAPLFEGVAHRFCVHVYRAELKTSRALNDVVAVLEREKPAHTTYHLCVIEPRMRVGFQARVGIDTIVAGAPSGMTLNDDRSLGYDSVLVEPDRGPGSIIGRQTRIGRNMTLA